jgi:hypothetical protein
MSVSRAGLRGFLAAALILGWVSAAAAGTLSGTVHNGTTGKPLAHQDVMLIPLRGDMQPVATVQTDAQGRYSFDRPEVGQGPLLIRVPYRDVNYHQSAPPGRTTVDVEVFDPTAPASAVLVGSQAMIFQPEGAKLRVGVEFLLQNRSNPPATYADSKGTFLFEIPPGAQLGQVSASGPAGMPLTQGTIDKGKNRFAISYPLKPGETNIRIAYDLPYDGNQAAIRAVVVMAAQRVLLAVPVGVQVAGEGFAPAGTEQGFTVFTRENVPAGTTFGVTLSGSAPAPSQASQAPQGGAMPPAEAAESLQPLAPRLASFQWIVVGGMGLFFLLGFFFLIRQPRAASIAAGGGPVAGAEIGSAARGKSSRAPAAAAAPSTNAATTLDEIERGVRTSLDELKDTLFRLELRHQAGTISEEEYGHERTRIEALLRKFVHG